VTNNIVIFEFGLLPVGQLNGMKA